MEKQTKTQTEEKLQVGTGTQTKKQLFAEIFRFLLVGGTATLADYLVFWLLEAFLFPAIFPQTAFLNGLALVLSTAFGFCVGHAVNWIFSVSFVFKQTKKQVTVRSKKEFITFTVIGLIGLAINELGMLLLVWLLPDIMLFGVVSFLSMPWKKWIAKCIVTVIVLIWNYIGRKKFVFVG